MTGLGDLTLLEAAAVVRDREVSPVELTEHYLDRIEATEPDVHAYVTVTADEARASARRAEAAVLAGERLGPLHGVPMGIKDLFDTAGVRTTYGSQRFEHHVPERDATAVARLRDAGAVILGKQATHELAWGGRTDSAHFGPTHNPHRQGHIAGGSSGGSAASVAVGSCLAAIGTDTAGSVRIPAALSGCVGYKPSRGTVSLAGVLPLAPTLDHVGALARTVADAAAVVDAMAGTDPADPGTQQRPPIGDVRPEGGGTHVAFLGGWCADLLDPGVAAALADVERRLAGTGTTTSWHDIPDEPGMTESVLTRILAEAGARHRAAFDVAPDDFGADLATLLRMPPPTARDLARSEAVVSRFSAALFDALTIHDVLLLPTVPVPAPRLGEQTVDGMAIELVLTRLTSPFNATGLPAVSVPVGYSDGLPVAVQVVGRPGADRTALAVAGTIEAVCGGGAADSGGSAHVASSRRSR